MSYNSKPKVNWLKETANSFSIIGKVLLRFLRVMSNVLLTLLLVCGICGIIIGGAFAIYLCNYVDSSIDEFDLLTTDQNLTTQIYYVDSQGNNVELENQRLFSSENRVWVSYTDIPENLVNAYVSVEDKRFWDHNGVDWMRTSKATFNFLLGSQKKSGGGSTLTQQLIKNITGYDDNTIQRKVQEIFRALNLEKTKSKEEILEMYLNTIYLSEGCYGVQAAAYKYFGKSVSDLSLLECCAIAGITQSPTMWDPILNPNNNKERRNYFLEMMYEQGKITQEEYDQNYNADLVLYNPVDAEDSGESTQKNVTSWYVDAVIEDTIDLLAKNYGVTESVATQMIYSGGLKIITAMDPDVQKSMEDIYSDDEYINKLVGASESLIQPESSMVVLDPYSGNVLGLVGGRGTKSSSRILNYATQTTRQPGSSIKPVAVYGPALDAGVINYSTVFDDVPQEFFKTDDGGYKPWPANSPSVYGGLTTVADGLARSVNTIAVQVLEKLGIDNSYDFLVNKVHLTSIIDKKEVNGLTMTDLNLSSLALGGLTYGVSVMELTGAYTMFTNDGVFTKPRTVLKIEDPEGKVIVNNAPQTDIAISAESAGIMRAMLHNVIEYGTGTSVTLGDSVYTCGKTGTTSSNYDRWFMGFTPYYLGGVWFGYENQQRLTNFSGNPAMKIWNAVMLKLHEKIISDAQASGEELKTFEMPSSVVRAKYCKDSGLIPSDACYLDPRGGRVSDSEGYYTRDNMPKDECSTHVKVKYCNTGHGIACDDCPASDVTEISLIKVTGRNFPKQVKVTDAEFVYRDLTVGSIVAADPSLPFFYNQIPNGYYVGITNTSNQYNHYCTAHYTGAPYRGGNNAYSTYESKAAVPDDKKKQYTAEPYTDSE